MRNQLINYVNLLFAGNPEAVDIKEEILQNTLDRYDDMIAQGRTPEAAYSLAISGIGDISELLRSSTAGFVFSASPVSNSAPQESEQKKALRKFLRGIAVGLFILCPIPLFLLQNEIGLCLLLAIVAVATVLIIFASKDEKAPLSELTPQQKMTKSISSLFWTIGSIIYFIVSFKTFAWHITWIIFPLIGAIEGLVHACMDLKEERKHEK